MPEFTIDKDIKHFIYDMTAYLQYQLHRSEQERARLILVGIKGTAKDVVMGYTEDETDTTEKVFRILKQEFKRHDKCAAGLYGIKQDSDEKISIFAGKIRKYVRGLGVQQEKFDHACIDFLKLGSLPHIKTRLIQLHPQTFRRALTIATEAESENNKITKNKTANNIEVVDATDGPHIRNEVQRLHTIIQEQDRRIRNLSKPVPQTAYANIVTKVGNGVLGACYHCHQAGHRYQQCRQASGTDKRRINDQIQQYRQQKRYNFQDRYRDKDHSSYKDIAKESIPLNSHVAAPLPQETRQ